MTNKIVFLAGARDYHAMDWYRSALKFIKNKEIVILTDLIGGEGFNVIINERDKIKKLFLLDKLLFKTQSRYGDIWRNILKLLVLPLQVVLLKLFYRKNRDSVFFAHGMYYMLLANFSNVPYIGTPQGSEILIRPFKSKLYKHFASKSLKGAKYVTVDSEDMRNKIKNISGIDAKIIQNGIDIKSINLSSKSSRYRYTSIRAFTNLYRIDEILKQRESSKTKNIRNIRFTFVYPFYDDLYKKEIQKYFKKGDLDLGRVDRSVMYDILYESKLVFSIPFSDSSPRSVYEAIFCGAVVAATYNKYIDALPDCMRSRIIIIDLNNKNWLEDAVFKSEKLSSVPFKPTKNVLKLFDQEESFKKVSNLLLS